MTEPTWVHSAPRDWARLHPVTPVLKAWPAALGVGALWFYTGGPEWLGGGMSDGDIPNSFRFPVLAFVALAIVAAAFAIGIAHIAWRFNRFRITDEAIEQHKGVLFRQQRHARLDRLQAVDVVQPLVARLFGFAQVRVEVAGGENSGVVLEYLRLGDAEALRNEVLALAAGRRRGAQSVAADQASADGAVGQPAPAPSLSLADVDPLSSRAFATAVPGEDQREVYAVPLGRLAMSIVRSWGAVWAAAFIPVVIAAGVVAAQSVTFREALFGVFGGSFAGIFGAITGLGAYTFAMLNRGFNFQAAIAPDGIRLRHGLLETRRQTVPPGRVQAVRLQQSLLWRSKDWWQISINVAGYQENQEAVSTLLPVGPRSEALLALHLVLPELDATDPDGVIGTALDGVGGEGGFTASPRSSRWIDPWQWRRRGVRATDTALLIRRGFFVRELFVVPHERTQSLRIEQGPIQRRLDLASVSVQSTSGPVKPVAHHLAVVDALVLLDEQAERARRRRKVQTPEQWAAAVETVVPAVAPSTSQDSVES